MKIESYLRTRTAVLEIGAAGASDQQRVAGEDTIAHQVTVGIVGVARRVHHVEADALDLDFITVADAHRNHVGFGLLAHHSDALGTITQLT